MVRRYAGMPLALAGNVVDFSLTFYFTQPNTARIAYLCS
ncbi:hypothetical protein NAS2_1053 [Conexivisphaera calida]|uniref:Uncharacterized protein n=1 Tax=Conexivisphaera calida TaxID=1874277 RepID=A0A4P2VGR2_9ARCH|nr:hypothetical protein NAS2_1053 [Conexivisphaera calida]